MNIIHAVREVNAHGRKYMAEAGSWIEFTEAEYETLWHAAAIIDEIRAELEARDYLGIGNSPDERFAFTVSQLDDIAYALGIMSNNKAVSINDYLY